MEIETAQKEFREFNAQCSLELKEMNSNRITNIIERGGVEGWETVSFSLTMFRHLILLSLNVLTALHQS